MKEKGKSEGQTTEVLGRGDLSYQSVIPWLEPWNFYQKVVLALGNLILVVIVGLLDYFTEQKLSLYVFYGIPIYLSSWFGGRFLGLFLALVSAAAWLLVDIRLTPERALSFLPLWNLFLWISFLGSMGYILALLREALYRQTRLSRQDFLTGLHNVRGFYEMAEREVSRAQRNDNKVTLAYLDLDNFKEVNDQYGHDEGNDLLQEVAALFRNNIRKTDVAARLGGDEFALLLPDADRKEGESIIGRIQENMKESMEEKGYNVTFSIGVITFDSPPGVTEMVRQTDDLMYQVKKGEKNRALFRKVKEGEEVCKVSQEVKRDEE